MAPSLIADKYSWPEIYCSKRCTHEMLCEHLEAEIAGGGKKKNTHWKIRPVGFCTGIERLLAALIAVCAVDLCTPRDDDVDSMSMLDSESAALVKEGMIYHDS